MLKQPVSYNFLYAWISAMFYASTTGRTYGSDGSALPNKGEEARKVNLLPFVNGYRGLGHVCTDAGEWLRREQYQ